MGEFVEFRRAKISKDLDWFYALLQENNISNRMNHLRWTHKLFFYYLRKEVIAIAQYPKVSFKEIGVEFD
ncbi:MAG: hypothetical protein EU529_04940 [Promethearchaeota archaeon]|nr:MAG: hypothetical protein EU529_04940 [Candidatus Lokiarchaeota archaeon]